MPDRNPSSRARPQSAAELTRVEHLLPFWGPQLVILVAIIIDVTLPDRLVPFGPRWLLPGLEALLLIGLVAASPQPRWRHSPARRRFALGLIALVSAANIVSLMLLVHYLLQPAHVNTSTGSRAHPRRLGAVDDQRPALRGLVLGARPRRPAGPAPRRGRPCLTSCFPR